MSKHTPGPWSVNLGAITHPMEILGPNKVKLALITAHDMRHSENARLIAAAPELLDAAVEAWNAFDNGKRKHHTDALTRKCIKGCQACAIKMLSEAIAKAEGRSNE